MKAVIILVLVICVVLSALFVEAEQPNPPRVVIAGSSCMSAMLNRLAIEAEKEGLQIEIQLGGTQQGLYALQKEVADIAACSRSLSALEQAAVNPTAIAWDTIVVVTNPANPVSFLSMEQLSQIYQGRITCWSELGGAKSPIVVIGRESGSGTRAAFEQALELNSPLHGQELCETGMVRTAVATTSGAIGYLSKQYVDHSVKKMTLQNEGLFSRPLYLCSSRQRTSEEAEAFIQFAISTNGKQIIRDLGIEPYVEAYAS